MTCGGRLRTDLGTDADPTLPDLAPGHPGIIIAHGALPPGVAWHFNAESHILLLAEGLPPAAAGTAVAEVLTELSATVTRAATPPI